jgi:hypothetical protein
MATVNPQHDFMIDEKILSELVGVETVKDWFGGWPSFHDAEIVGLALTRTGPSVLRVYPYTPHKPATVDFVLERVTDIELSDFSPQNVINDLSIEKALDQNNASVYRILLAPCYGLAGRIDATSVQVKLHPGPSPDGVSQW